MTDNPARLLAPPIPRGARARTQQLMLETALKLMQQGALPSVSDVAEASGVSRATAYRYFPTQSAMVEAVVDEALEPIVNWSTESEDAEERIAELLEFSLPQILQFEATFKAALKVYLDQWAQERVSVAPSDLHRRGHRIDVLQHAIEPLRSKLPRASFQRLSQALSLVYGLEVFLVLKDLWGLEYREVRNVALWAARALVRAAVAERANETNAKVAAPRPRKSAPKKQPPA
jgi:AcrR family transcriptional regulator